MIIRITFHDNDYKNVLEDFLKYGLVGIFLRLKTSVCDNSEESLSKYKMYAMEQDEIFRLINEEKKFSKEGEKRLIELIKESMLIYLKEKCKVSYEYLSENLEIKIVNQIKDTWENGEVAYYLPLSDVTIIM